MNSLIALIDFYREVVRLHHKCCDIHDLLLAASKKHNKAIT